MNIDFNSNIYWLHIEDRTTPIKLTKISLASAVFKYLDTLIDGSAVFRYPHSEFYTDQAMTMDAKELIKHIILSHRITMETDDGLLVGYMLGSPIPTVYEFDQFNEAQTDSQKLARQTDNHILWVANDLPNNAMNRYIYHWSQHLRKNSRALGDIQPHKLRVRVQNKVLAQHRLREPLQDPHPGTLAWAEHMGSFYKHAGYLPPKFQTRNRCIKAKYQDPEGMMKAYTKEQLYFIAKSLGLKVTKKDNKWQLCEQISKK